MTERISRCPVCAHTCVVSGRGVCEQQVCESDWVSERQVCESNWVSEWQVLSQTGLVSGRF